MYYLFFKMTLYKDGSGKYLEKKGKLVLKGISKETQKPKILGFARLSLHTLAGEVFF